MQQERYEVIFQANRDRIYRLAMRVVTDPILAEDVLQEVHVKCWKHRRNLEDMQNPGGWILRVTKNLSIDKIRSRKEVSDLADVEYYVKTREPVPDRSAETANLLHIMKTLVEKLPEKQKLIFQLREIEGLQYKEISEVLEVSLEEVKVNLFRARQKIKAKLNRIQSYGLSTVHT